jgi:hypothetical protein
MVRWPVIIVKDHGEYFTAQQIMNLYTFLNYNRHVFNKQIARNVIVLKTDDVFNQNADRLDLIIFESYIYCVCIEKVTTIFFGYLSLIDNWINLIEVFCVFLA